ncbi:MAG: DUF5011 domain-containing protein [Peptostreptococcaceae bacterium]
MKLGNNASLLDRIITAGSVPTDQMINNVNFYYDNKRITLEERDYLLARLTPEVIETYPVFAGINAKTINFGTSFNNLSGVTATDEIDGDLTKDINVYGEVDVNKAGTYTLTYEVMNLREFKTTKIRKITVKEEIEDTTK